MVSKIIFNIVIILNVLIGMYFDLLQRKSKFIFWAFVLIVFRNLFLVVNFNIFWRWGGYFIWIICNNSFFFDNLLGENEKACCYCDKYAFVIFFYVLKSYMLNSYMPTIRLAFYGFKFNGLFFCWFASFLHSINVFDIGSYVFNCNTTFLTFAGIIISIFWK